MVGCRDHADGRGIARRIGLLEAKIRKTGRHMQRLVCQDAGHQAGTHQPGSTYQELVEESVKEQIVDLLREYDRCRAELKEIKVEMTEMATRLGLDQVLALQDKNAELFLDGWLVGKGHIQQWRVGK